MCIFISGVTLNRENRRDVGVARNRAASPLSPGRDERSRDDFRAPHDASARAAPQKRGGAAPVPEQTQVSIHLMQRFIDQERELAHLRAEIAHAQAAQVTINLA